VKLYLTHRALTLRRERPRLFAAGGYRPLEGGGRHADHLVALARTDAEAAVLVAVPRLTARLAGLTGRFPLGEAAWGETWIALPDDLAGVYRDRLSGLTLASERHDGRARLPAPALLAHFPVALLERVEPAPGGPSG
jgi:(1->4)-alpha-D-glucan 1-alpha-D-glucosylmutase